MGPIPNRGVMRGFLGGRTPGSFHMKGLQKRVVKKFVSECGSKSGIMRGFQKGITLGGRTSGSFHMVGLQNRVAKKFAKILHPSGDPRWGS